MPSTRDPPSGRGWRRAWLTGAGAAALLAVGGAAWAEATAVLVDPHAEVAAAVFSAAATQEAAQKADDAKITAQRAEIVALSAKVRAGQAKSAQLVAAEE